MGLKKQKGGFPLSIFDKKPNTTEFPAARDFFAGEIIKKSKRELNEELKLWNGYFMEELSTPNPHPLALRDISWKIGNIKIFMDTAGSKYWINRQIARAIDDSGILIDTIETKNGDEVALIGAFDRQVIDSVNNEIKELPLDHPDWADVFSKRKVEKRRLNSQIRQNRGAIALHLGLVGGRDGHSRCSKPELTARQKKNIESDNWIARTTIKGKNGESFKLADAGATKLKK